MENLPLEIARRLDELKLVDPDGLAELFLLALRPNETSKALLHTLHASLLSRTVRHAHQHVAWYQRRQEYAEWAPEISATRLDLTDLPILDRELVAEELSEFIADDVQLCSVCHTSGTTTGTPLQIHKSYQELDYLNKFFLRLLSTSLTDTPRPLTLSFPNFYHGTPVSLPGIGMTLVGGATDDLLLDDAVRTLNSSYDFSGHKPRITSLNGLVNHVLLLTSYLLEHGLDPAQFQLESITIGGGIASPHWRDFLSKTWNSPVIDRFSLSETVGGASRCHKCDRFHLDPHVYGEVIDVDTRRPITQGVGSLLLTNLYPLVQMQPLIRYDSGDLVYLYPSDCAHTLTFEFLGKRRNAISFHSNSRTEWLLFSASLNDALTELPDVRKFEWASNVRGVRDRTIGGLPLVAVSVSNDTTLPTINLVIELLYAPQFHRDRSEELRRHIVGSLLSTKGTSLGANMESGGARLIIEFVGPGTLTEPALKV